MGAHKSINPFLSTSSAHPFYKCSKPCFALVLFQTFLYLSLSVAPSLARSPWLSLVDYLSFSLTPSLATTLSLRRSSSVTRCLPLFLLAGHCLLIGSLDLLLRAKTSRSASTFFLFDFLINNQLLLHFFLFVMHLKIWLACMCLLMLAESYINKFNS